MIADPTFVDQSKILVLYIAELLGDFFEGFLGTLSPKAFVGCPCYCSFCVLIHSHLDFSLRDAHHHQQLYATPSILTLATITYTSIALCLGETNHDQQFVNSKFG